MMASLRAGLEVAMRVDRGRPAVRGKLVDVILIVGAAALVLVVVLLNLAQEVLFGRIRPTARPAGSRRRPLRSRRFIAACRSLVTTGVVLLLYRFVPARRLKLGDALAGAIVTAILLLAISLVSGIIFERTRSLSTHLRLALTSALDLPLLGLSLRIGVSARCRDRRRMVTSVRTDRRTALAPDQAGRARALRPSGPSPTRPPERPRVPTDPPV